MSQSTKTILIIEDEVAQLNVLKEKLKLEGFTVLTAGDGDRGIKIAIKEHPDLILLDIIMPKLDGMTALKKLREDDWGKTARVIVLSNLNDNENVAKAMERGTFEYLVKTDWSLKDIVAKVHEVLAV